MAEGYNSVPEVNYDRSRRKLIDEYKRAYKDVLAAVVELSTIGETDDIYQRQASTLRQIEVILANLDETQKAWCQEELKAAFVNGQAAALLSAGMATTLAEATQGVSFSQIAQETVDALITDTYDDLLSATQHTEKRIKQVVRQEVGNIIRQRAIQRYGRNTMRNDIVKSLTKKGLSERVTEDGFVGIIDKAGRKWDLNRYADMVVRTKLSQGHTEGVRVTGIERGVDTAVISTHNAPDACGKYEGMIISLNGLTPGLLTYEELRQGNDVFHPNCGHSVLLIRLQYFPQKLKDKHDAKVAAFRSNKHKKPVPVKDIKIPEKSEVQGLNVELSLS
jgi:hypothetical protein